jgi:preprotein translocase subunit SecG
MGFLIGLLTLVMVLDCFILVFLVLIQLPKKDAGAGLAFGGAASDALFGAGSGNVLTKVTKYAAVIFFVLAIILAVMQSRYHSGGASALQKKLAGPGAPAATQTTPGPAPATTPSPTAPAVTPPTVRTSVAAQASDVPLSPTNITAPTTTAPVPQK